MAQAWIFQIDPRGMIPTQNMQCDILTELGEDALFISEVSFYTDLHRKGL